MAIVQAEGVTVHLAAVGYSWKGRGSRRLALQTNPLLDNLIVRDGLHAADAAGHHARTVLDLGRVHKAAQLDDILEGLHVDV